MEHTWTRQGARALTARGLKSCTTVSGCSGAGKRSRPVGWDAACREDRTPLFVWMTSVSARGHPSGPAHPSSHSQSPSPGPQQDSHGATAKSSMCV